MKKNNIPIIKKKNGYNTPTGKNKNLSTKKKIQKTPHNTESFYRKENIKDMSVTFSVLK